MAKILRSALDKTKSLHNQETDFEDHFLGHKKGDFTRLYELLKVDTSFYHPTGKSSLQSVAHHFAGAKQVLLVHDTFTKEADLDFIAALSNLQQTQYHFCLCVNANLYINKALPPIELLRQKKCSMVLRIVWLAITNSVFFQKSTPFKNIFHRFHSQKFCNGPHSTVPRPLVLTIALVVLKKENNQEWFGFPTKFYSVKGNQSSWLLIFQDFSAEPSAFITTQFK